MCDELTPQVTDEIKKFFEENPNESVYCGNFGIGGNAKVLGSAITNSKSLGKALYLFSADLETGKVAHVNFLPKEVLDRKALDAKSWLGEVSKVVGGRGGGKDDSATGVGSEVDKLQEGVEAARKVYKEKVEGA